MDNELKTDYIEELKEIVNNTLNKNYERDLIIKLLDYCLDDEAITEEQYKTIKKKVNLTKKKALTKEMLFDSLVDSFNEKIGLSYGLTVKEEPGEEIIFIYDENKKAIELTLNGKSVYSFERNSFMLNALKVLFENLERAY